MSNKNISNKKSKYKYVSKNNWCKKKRMFVALCLTFFIFSQIAFAHSGKTDASGGHHDNKNKSRLGSYHYHCGGYPAHLHPNGICPYSSFSESTSTPTPTPTPTSTPIPTLTPTSTPTPTPTLVREPTNEAKKIEIRLTIGQTRMDVNGINKEIDPENPGSAAPTIENNRTFMPVRAIIEAIGGKVEWDKNTEKVTLIVNGKVLEMWIGKPSMTVNGINKLIYPYENITPKIIKNRTMLPIRAIIQELGGIIEWSNERIITIRY